MAASGKPANHRPVGVPKGVDAGSNVPSDLIERAVGSPEEWARLIAARELAIAAGKPALTLEAWLDERNADGSQRRRR